MMSSSQTEKVAGRCPNCDRHAAAPDNFCRWCGTHRREAALSTTDPVWQTGSTTVLGQNVEMRSSKTTGLGRAEEPSQSLSRLSLETLSQSVAMKTGSLRLNRYGALLVAMLIAIPMWLLIVLLSPFDAYLSAKAAWSQMNVR